MGASSGGEGKPARASEPECDGASSGGEGKGASPSEPEDYERAKVIPPDDFGGV